MPVLIDVLLVLVMPSIVHAAPRPPTRPRSALHPRQSPTDSPPPGPPQSGGLTVQIWAPLIAIIIVILVMIFLSCYRRRRAAIANPAQTVAATQLTAAQLTGANAGTTSRRPRRTRRTPSQISTRSLPAYMEDPGDSEMVLARGIEDMQDPMPTVAEDRENPASQSQADLHNVSGTSFNLSFNASTTSQTPLLHTHSNSQDQSQDQGQLHPGHEFRPPGSNEDPSATRTSVANPSQSLLRSTSNGSSHVRSSIDTVRTMGSGSEESQRGLLGVGWELGAIYGDRQEGISGLDGDRARRVEREETSNGRNGETALSAEELQARGEAPPYFEVVERQTGGMMEMTAVRRDGSTGGQAGIGTNGTEQTREPRRRSGFRSFAARLSQLMPSGSSQSGATTPPPSSPIPLLPSPLAGTVRAAPSASSAQTTSPPLSTPPTNPRDRIGHRRATSGSVSTILSATSVTSPTSAPGASHASPSTTSLPRMPRSRSRLAGLLSGNTSQTTIPRPGASQLSIANQNLSTTSLSSTLISPPLPHTLVRASFVYPNAGPTTEQMRFISSRESIARFGVPYGRAAEEAALRAEAAGVGEEPPPFDWEGEGGGEESGERGEANEGEDEADGSDAPAGSLGGGTGENAIGGENAGETAAPSSTTPYVAPKRTSSRPGMERELSQMSDGSFETAPEDANDVAKRNGEAAGEDSKETEWDFEAEGLNSNAGAGTTTPPSSTLPPNISVITTLGQDGAAASTVDPAKSVPTPPPTPPGTGGHAGIGNGLGLGGGASSRTGSDSQTHMVVPRIEVAPASPA